MHKYLIETALLGQGLASISDQDILSNWHSPQAQLVWIISGEIKIGTLEDFLPLRQKADQLSRIDASSLSQAITEKATGVLTASATMAVCSQEQILLAVTCGMGGIGPKPTNKIGSDLLALRQWPIALIAAAPKDVFDLPATLAWLHDNGIIVVGANSDICDGFLIHDTAYKLDGQINQLTNTSHLLILNGLAKRPVTNEILLNAMKAGEHAEQQGKYYHPTVNQKLDEDTCGLSSREQLKGLLANIALAEQL